jgi:hypothetical protein
MVKTSEAEAGCLPADLGWPTAGCRGRSGQRPCQSGGEAYWGSDGEGAHQSLARDGDGGRHRGAPVRGRRSRGNPELKRCQCNPGRSGARGGRDGAGRWLERPVVDELAKERRQRGTSDGSMGKWLRAPVVRAMSTAG